MEPKEKQKEPSPKGPLEHLYDKIPLTVRQLDFIILLLVIAFIVFFTLGVINAR